MFEVGDRTIINDSAGLEPKYKGIKGTIMEQPQDNPVGAYRFKPDVALPDQPEQWLIFEDEMDGVTDE